MSDIVLDHYGFTKALEAIIDMEYCQEGYANPVSLKISDGDQLEFVQNDEISYTVDGSHRSV